MSWCSSMHIAVNCILSLINCLKNESTSSPGGITTNERCLLAELWRSDVLNLNKDNLKILGNVLDSILNYLETMPLCEFILLIQQYCEWTNNNESCLQIKQGRYQP